MGSRSAKRRPRAGRAARAQRARPGATAGARLRRNRSGSGSPPAAPRAAARDGAPRGAGGHVLQAAKQRERRRARRRGRLARQTPALQRLPHDVRDLEQVVGFQPSGSVLWARSRSVEGSPLRCLPSGPGMRPRDPPSPTPASVGRSPRQTLRVLARPPPWPLGLTCPGSRAAGICGAPVLRSPGTGARGGHPRRRRARSGPVVLRCRSLQAASTRMRRGCALPAFATGPRRSPSPELSSEHARPANVIGFEDILPFRSCVRRCNAGCRLVHAI